MGHYHIRPGNLVYINDSALFGLQGTKDTKDPPESDVFTRDAEVALNFFTEMSDFIPEPPLNNGGSLDALQITSKAFTGAFGTDLSVGAALTTSTPFSQGHALPLYWEDTNSFGCNPYQLSDIEGAVVVHRGQCTFLEKLLNVKQAGGKGVVVISDQDGLISPSTNPEDLAALGDMSDAFIVVLPSSEGDRLIELTVRGAQLGHVTTFVSLVRDPASAGSPPEEEESKATSSLEDEPPKPAPDRHLFLNGYPLMNTRLLV